MNLELSHCFLVTLMLYEIFNNDLSLLSVISNFHGPGSWGGPWTPVHVFYSSWWTGFDPRLLHFNNFLFKCPEPFLQLTPRVHLLCRHVNLCGDEILTKRLNLIGSKTKPFLSFNRKQRRLFLLLRSCPAKEGMRWFSWPRVYEADSVKVRRTRRTRFQWSNFRATALQHHYD